MGGILPFFPTPFPNEDSKSIFYRYHLNSFNSEIIDTNMELVGIRNNFTIFPKSLEELIAKLPITKHLDVDSVVYNYTLLPVLLPFIPKYHHSKILNEIQYGGRWEESSAGKLTGNKYGKNISDMIKYCPSCIEEDVEHYGCSYIHRDHQYAFIHICSKHSDKLITHCKECGVVLDYSPLTEQCKNGHRDFYLKEREYIDKEIQKNTLKDLEYVITHSRKINRALIEQRFIEYLNAKGYISKTTNSIITKRLIKDLSNFVSPQILIEFGMDVNHIKQYHTLENVFHGSQLVVNLPLSFLLIQFLAGSIENFLLNGISYACEIPFGNGPWCCENKYCPKYKQNVITRCERSYKAGKIKGKLTCDFCETSYVMSWNVNGANKQTNRRKIEYLDIKREQILSLWEKGMSVEEIGKQLYCTPYIVKKVVKQKYKGCNLNQLQSFSETASSLEDKLIKNRAKHRSRLQDVLNIKEEMTRSEIKTKCKSSYEWLKQHDQQWLEGKLPPSKTTGKLEKSISLELNRKKYRSKLLAVLKENNGLMRSEIMKKCKTAYIWLKKNDQNWLERQLPSSKSIVKFDWNEVDQNLAERVKLVSKQLIDSNPNTRVARYSIIGALTKTERGRIKTYIKNLPKTDSTLNECAETKEQYQFRHLPALVWQLRNYYGYTQVTIDTIMSYRKSYRGIAEEMKDILIEELKKL